MSGEPALKRSHWPVIIVVVAMVVLIVTFAVGVHFSSTSGTSDSQPTSVDSLDVLIDIFDYKYHTADVSVPRGAEVTWVNDDKAPHTATERNSDWDTGVLGEGESVLIRFSRPGAYEYYCTIHPYMSARITVR